MKLDLINLIIEKTISKLSGQRSPHCCKRATTKPSKNFTVFRMKNWLAAITCAQSPSKIPLIKGCCLTSWFITTVPWNAKHRTWHSRRTWCGNFIEELYERSGNINCKKHDLVNKQIDTDGRQLDSKLCDLIYLLVALILSHDLAKHKFA